VGECDELAVIMRRVERIAERKWGDLVDPRDDFFPFGGLFDRQGLPDETRTIVSPVSDWRDPLGAAVRSTIE